MPISAYLLLLANAIPLGGVLFWQWDTTLVLALFWIENLIIGAFNLLKMAWTGVLNKQRQAIFLCCFFVLHYGAFCIGHGLLLTDLLELEMSVESVLGIESSGLPGFFLEGVAVFVYFVRNLAPAIWMGMIALLLSHLGSFIEHFILRGEMFNNKLNDLMIKPYQQIMVMHAGLIIGAFVLQRLGSPVWLLAVLVVLKIAVDFIQFRKRHAQSELAEERAAERVKDI